jgi:hypothetical protein
MPNRTERDAITAASASEAAQGKKEAEDIAHRAVIAKDVDELRTAVVTLASRVSSLSEALTAVNEIQQRQTATERATKEVQEKADATEKQTASLAASVIPREEQEYKEALRLEQEKKARKDTVFKIYQSVGLLIIVIAVAILGLVNYQQGQRGALYKVCVQRNVQDQKVLQVLTSRDPAAPPPTALQLRNLETLKDAFAVSDCEKLR